MNTLFVYGTLRSDAPRAGLLGNCPRERATVRGTLYALPAGYPAISLDGDTAVRGELVRDVPDALLRVLDLYEGVEDGLYRRVEVTALAGMHRVQCLAYVMDRPRDHGGRMLKSGFWPVRDR